MTANRSILPLRLSGLTWERGGEQLLGPLDLEFDGEKRVVVLGPNGAGKSLLLRLAHGLIPPSSGSVAWAEADPGRQRSRQAMVFDRAVLLRRSARANVEYALALRGVAAAERAARTDQVLAQTGLLELANRAARALSAGEQQRLALARAWALRPELLFLDEPTASLDPAAARRVEQLILQIREAGTAVMLTTHDLGLARRIAEEVVFLYRGRVLEHAAASAFFEAPATREARAFLQGDLTW